MSKLARHVLLEFNPSAVYYMTNYFFYHGDRIARIKLKNKSINGMIEFYNDELPIAVTEEEDDKIVTLTRAGAVVAKFALTKTSLFRSKFDLTVSDKKIFPLAILLSVCIITRIFKYFPSLEHRLWDFKFVIRTGTFR
jgi:hypothetical protein